MPARRVRSLVRRNVIQRRRPGGIRRSRAIKGTRFANARRSRISYKGGRRRSFKRLRSVSRNVDQSGSTSVVWKGRPRMKGLFKGLKKVLGPRTVNSLTTTKVPYGANTQAAVMLNLFWNGASNFPYIAGFGDMSEFVTNLRQDDFEPFFAGSQYKTMKYWVPKVKVVHRIRNMGTAPANITLYDLVARRDQTTGVIEPIIAWGNGISNATSSAIGISGSVSRPGTTPFMSGEFTQYFKIVRVHEFTLHAGATHKHYMTLFPNKMWTPELAATTTYHANETMFTMLVAKGDVGQVDDTSPANFVVYTNGLVEVITEYRATVAAMAKNKRLNTNYSNLEFTPSLPIEQVVEDTDIISAVETV